MSIKFEKFAIDACESTVHCVDSLVGKGFGVFRSQNFIAQKLEILLLY